MIFHPTRNGDWEHDDSIQDVVLDVEEGVRLHCWYRPAPAGGRTILFCHGNSGNIAGRRGFLEILSGLGFGVFLLEYRGFGKSTGHLSEAGVYADARAAYDWLRFRDINPVIFGNSLGTAVATELALHVEAPALVLQSPFTSLHDMARGLKPIQRMDTLAKIRWVGEPLLVIHSTRDETVPFEHGRRVFEAAREPKTFCELARAGHNTIWRADRDAVERALLDFLGSLR